MNRFRVNDLPKILCIHSDKQIYQTYHIVWISSESRVSIVLLAEQDLTESDVI